MGSAEIKVSPAQITGELMKIWLTAKTGGDRKQKATTELAEMIHGAPGFLEQLATKAVQTIGIVSEQEDGDEGRRGEE